MLYMLVTFSAPFDGDDNKDITKKILRKKYTLDRNYFF